MVWRRAGGALGLEASLLHSALLPRSVGRSGREKKEGEEKVDRMEGKGSFLLRSAQLSSTRSRPPCRYDHLLALCIYLERGHGADGQKKEDRRRGGGGDGKKDGRKEGRSRGGLSPSLPDVTEESNREEERGEEREKQTNKASSPLPSTPCFFTSCPAHSPAAPLSSCSPFCELTISFTPSAVEGDSFEEGDFGVEGRRARRSGEGASFTT